MLVVKKNRLCKEANEEHDGRPGEGLSLPPKGAAPEGRVPLAAESWHGLKRQIEDSHCDRRELRLCFTGTESPV